MKYKIGDVARILGISSDLLRYYERKGVVKPEKNENNDYRYYDSWDINFLMDCLWFKNFGFSIEQTADIVKIPSVDDISSLFDSKQSEIQAELEHCRLLLRRLEEHQRDLMKTRDLLGRFEICSSPETVCYINRVGSEYSTDRGRECYARRWLKVMPFNRRCFTMSRQAITNGTELDCSWGYCLTKDYAQELGFEFGPLEQALPSEKCIHTVFKTLGGRNGFEPGLLGGALDYAEEQGCRVNGTVWGVLLASVMEKELTGYFEAWLPIE